MIDIIANFFKWTRGNRTLGAIAEAYLRSGEFFFDIVATLPCLFMGEGIAYYGLKCFRIYHFFRITKPLDLLLSFTLQRLSKKRQSDLSGFACLILYVVYISHIMACVWLHLGKLDPCKLYPDSPWDETSNNDADKCTASWVYADGFELMPYTS